ncbi:hypothetical protein KL86DYS1_30810 [uncultured Dysgonomonas sp.]|uniref:Uncharacterized protein n=1 Tax=uncultured Dysgonomonas sp. TaxID=206096 RepID=A0A212JYI7_9BACT|nr:hypothetical protein KL86DYS1_30810 [uncultured Dysgonomonas sp.]
MALPQTNQKAREADTYLIIEGLRLLVRQQMRISSAGGHLSGAAGVERNWAIARLSLSAGKPLTGRRGTKR